MRCTRWLGGLALALVAALAVGSAPAMAKKGETVDVCKHGCDYRTIQDAVDATGKKAVIEVHPGKYREGVRVSGHRHDGLTIVGTGKNSKKVILEGKRAKDPDGQPANHGIEGASVNNLRVINLWVRNYLANGVFIHDCHGYLMEDLRASFNRGYGLFAFNCTGGRMTDSVGWGQGDSAFYVGETPFQNKPKWTKLDHLDGHENVLGYSGTNSKYVKITKSDFYNNGVGVVPNTLDSERFEPTATGIIQKSNIFWNNFNYFLPSSRVQTVSNGLGMVGDLTINFPTGVGVVLLGADGWIVRENKIFGNFKAGAWAISDPFNCEGPSTGDCTPVTTQSIATTSSSTTRWAATAPIRTRTTSSTTAPAAATASPATRARPSTRAPRQATPRCTRRARHRRRRPRAPGRARATPTSSTSWPPT